MRKAFPLLGFTLLVSSLWSACSKGEAPPPIPEGVEASRREGGKGAPEPLAGSGLPAAGGAGARPAAEADPLPPGESRGGGRLHLEPGGGSHRIPWAVFRWPAAVEGGQKKFRLTTRPAGTGAWPWITLEAWIPVKGGLEEWAGTRTALNKIYYQEGPGLAPWPRKGPCYLVIRKAGSREVELDLHLELMDPLHGVKRTVTGTLKAVKAGKP